MGNPIRFLTSRLRNGKAAASGGPSSNGREQATTEGEVSERENDTVWHVSEVYQEIWDNDEDAVYDDL